MARKVKAGTAVAYWPDKPSDDWPGGISWKGPGFYEVISEDDSDHTQAKFGQKLEFRLDKPNEAGQPADPENNEGHFVYADSVDEEES